MDISKLTKKPQLTKIEISDKDIVDQYGDIVSFWIIDEMDISTYFNFYKLQQSQDSNQLNELLRTLILKEDGTPAIASDEILPVNLTLAVLVAINDFLGKSNTKQVDPEIGVDQN
jgi:hypothetical protein